LFAAWLFTDTAHARQPDCAAASRAQESGEAARHLAEARCWLEAGQYGAALLAAERSLAYRPGDPEGLALREAALGMLKLVRIEHSGTRGWIALQAGYDSNFNSGTDAAEISLPLFRGIIVDIEEKLGELRRRSSPVLGAHAGFAARAPVTAQNALRLDGFAALRVNTAELGYLPSVLQFDVEADHRAGPLRLAFGVGLDQRWIGRFHVLNAVNASARVSADLDGGYTLAAFAAASDRKYPLYQQLPALEERAGLALEHPAAPFRVRIYRGSERSTSAFKFLDRDFSGISAEGSLRLGPGRFEVAVHQIRNAYTEFSQLFLGHRLDRYREIHLAYQYRLSPAWEVAPRLVLQENHSNIAITEFKRTQVLAEIRREF
jgi:hypothetical protein